MNPLDIIEPLRESDQYIEAIYMQGGCYQFHLFLKNIFPEAEPYINRSEDHVVSFIDGSMYDIRGKVDPENESQYRPITEDDMEMVERWSFHREMRITIDQCPFCLEPVFTEHPSQMNHELHST